MNEPFLGAILAFGFTFNPRGWQTCSGQLISIAQNTALFSLLGTTYGGNGQTTFALPDLRGRTMIGVGNGPGLTPVVYGQVGGTETTTLTINNMPQHNHQLIPGTLAGQVNVATNALAATGGAIANDTDNGANSFAAGGSTPNIYSEPGTGTTKIGGITSAISGSTAIAGGSQAFSIRDPYLGINYCIAMEGIFPSRN
ncbi:MULTISPECIES: phage tail protein [Flavobacterium]|uniref:phage tail protein n=1 Tax=Flavobacterium TaxID=237 RepID=UPI002114A732|nr:MULTISPECIES: tail fiber protein [Flavobacterium]UUF13555.1 tail fiber protein [Flavobacterium panici]